MSERKPKPEKVQTTIPRQSPRFFSRNSPEAFDPKTPKEEFEANRILHSISTPLSSKLVKDEVSRKSKANVYRSKRSMRLSEIKNQEEEVSNGIGSISGEEKENNVGRRKGKTGKKAKMKEGDDEGVCRTGWTKEQEQALQIAYFSEKPTPQFWKRVSKMVPGKSAQDCFNKIHSAHSTPPQAQPRSRAKKIVPTSLSFSASKLLSSPEPKSKRSRYKHGSHLAQKAVRQLLQKQCNNDTDEGADLFAIFEATVDPFNLDSQQSTSFCTPEQKKGGSSFLNRCHESSPSADRKPLSQLNMSSEKSLISPPVLKQIKNKALHDKYIDQLHRRETKRKAALARAAKQVSQKTKPRNQDGKQDALNAARNALYFDASDAINQFQQSQMNAIYNCDLSDNDHPKSGDDESED